MAKGFYGFGILTKDNKPLMEGNSPIIDNETKELDVIADMPGTAKMDIVIEDKENNDSMGVRLDQSQVEQLIDTLLYWVEKQ